jgi:hypothetical protein
MSERRAWLPLRMSEIPSPLRRLGWVGWRAEYRPGKKSKKHPLQIGYPSRPAANNRPSEWRTEGDAREAQVMTPGLFDGYGVVLVESANLTFIDLDGVRNPESGVIDEWALELVRIFDTWTEISASGEGLHIFCFGRLPDSARVGCLDGDPGQPIEVYDRGRFAFLTGHALEPVRPLVERQRLVTALAQCVRSAGATTPRPTPLDETPIPQGQRNDKLFRIARGFVRHGLRGRDLEQALLAVSHRRCVPVPPDADVIKIARHAERLPDRTPTP